MADLKKIKVLLAVTHIDHKNNEKYDVETEESIRKQLMAQGYDPTFIIRRKKKEIKKYLAEDVYCSYAIIMELADDGAWDENELAELVDERMINLVVVLTNQRRTQPTFLMTLYAAGITSAVFEGEKGVNESEVADLLIHPRSRRKTREYYRIDTKNISVRSLTNEMYNSICVRLADPEYGSCPMARLYNMASEINPYQMADFLEKIPTEIRQNLEEYAEYGQLIEQLRQSKLYVKYKRPKKFKTLDDKKNFNEDAKRALEEKGFDGSAYIEKEPEKKKGLFGGIKKKKEEKNKQETKISQAETVPVQIGLTEEDEESVVEGNEMEFPTSADEQPGSIKIENSFNGFDDLQDIEPEELILAEIPPKKTKPAEPVQPTPVQAAPAEASAPVQKVAQPDTDDDDFDPFM